MFKVLRLLALWGTLLLFIMFTGLWLLDKYYPMVQQQSFSTVVLADDGAVLRAFSNEQQQWRYPVDNKDVPENYLTLLLNYEDRWFYQHIGINPFSIMRAAWQNVSEQRIVSGGSTLTMQVARLLDPHERSLSGKLQQVVRALQLEWHLTKTEILNLYLNLAPFGGTLIGVQAASLSYFDKPLSELSDAEAALLAVLPQAPSRWRPDRHPKLAKAARDKVLKRMLALDVWSQARVEDALKEPIFSFEKQTPMHAPLLARRLRNACQDCEKIATFIDIGMQRQLSSLVKDYAYTMPAGVSIALMVMENDTGKVKSYIGSADFLNNQRFGHVDMIQAVRSPGSTLKPFLYAMAIDRGIVHSQSLLQDTPRYKQAYQPLNFSGGFNGPISVTQALQRSLNIPAVQVLEALEPAYFAAKLESAGLALEGPGAKKPNISMILGGVGTRLESLVGVYSALARSGITIKPRLTKDDPVIERYLLSEGAAWIGWRMLAINPSKNSRHHRISDYWPLAWKTGTSYGYREAWAMGVTKKWSIGVWVGRPDASSSAVITGRTSAAPLLFKVFKAISKDDGIARPGSVSEQTICWPLGNRLVAGVDLLAQNCQQKQQAWLLNDTAPRTLSQQPLLKKAWYNSLGQRAEPSCDSSALTEKELALWPIALEPWVQAQQRRNWLLANVSEQCQQLNTIDQPIDITSVADDSLYQFDPRSLSLQLHAQGGQGERYWYLNGRYLAKSTVQNATNFSINKRGRYQLSVVDEQGNTDLVTFEVQ